MPITLTFTGDIAYSGLLKDDAANTNLLESKILNFLKDSDHVIANVESPITTHAATNAATFGHTTPPVAAKTLKSFHIDTWNIANNHITDCGETGLIDTIAAAKKQNIKVFGPIYQDKCTNTITFTKDGLKIGIVALTGAWARLKLDDRNGCVFFDEFDRIEQQIAELHKNCNFVIALIHAGEEFTALPMPKFRQAYLRILDLGADLIVAHHPHVPQNYERVGDKIIFYSLGNFIFDTDFQRSQNHTDEGILLKLHFDKKGYTFDYLGVKIRSGLSTKTHGISAATAPTIFTDIDAATYKKLQPLAERQFFLNQQKANNFKYPNHHGKLRKALGRIKRMKDANIRHTEIANFKSHFYKTPKDIDPKIIDYIKEQD